MGLGLLVASVAYSALSIELTVLDAHRLADSARPVLDTEPVQRAMSERLSDSVAQSIGNFPFERTQIDAAARETMRDPRFQDAFAAGLVKLHERVFDDATGPIVLDASRVTDAVRTNLARHDPSLAERIPPGTTISVTIPADKIPNLSWVTRVVRAIALFGALGALLLVGAGLALHARAAWAIGRIGRWCLVLGALQLLIFWVVPRAVLPAFGDGATVAAAVINGVASAIVFPAVLLVVTGVSCVVGSSAWQRHVFRTEPPVRLSAPLGVSR